jgi:beta-phosphoglucomutase-like phosphatase (HAD superfamily)
MMALAERYQLNDARAVAQVMEGEAVIIDIMSGTYYSLDATGGRVWELMQDGVPLEEIAATLAREYDVDDAQAIEDVRALLRQLAAEQLIVGIGDGVGVDAPAAVATSVDTAAPRAAASGVTTASAATAASEASRKPYQAPALQVYRDMQDLLALDPPMPGLRDIPWK